MRNEEKWCQLFSEPGAGSDLASLATRAVRDGDEWVVSGQKVWTTWAQDADFAILLARTDPSRPKNKGITYFLVDMHPPGVDVRPLRHISGEVEFNEVFLDQARVPDFGAPRRCQRRMARRRRDALERAADGRRRRFGWSRPGRRLRCRPSPDSWRGNTAWPTIRSCASGSRALWSEERIRAWTNQRVASNLAAGQTPGPAASIGKVHQAGLNQRVQAAAVDLLGADAMAWDAGVNDQHDSDAYHHSLPFELGGMLRSRANTIEGGTTEVNKNILGERVLGLPREPDPWLGKPWSEIPRS